MVILLENENEYKGYGYDEEKQFKPTENTMQEIDKAREYAKEMMTTVFSMIDNPADYIYADFLEKFYYIVCIGTSKVSGVEAAKNAMTNNKEYAGAFPFADYVFVSVRVGRRDVPIDLSKIENTIRKLGSVKGDVEILMKLEYKSEYDDFVEVRAYC